MDTDELFSLADEAQIVLKETLNEEDKVTLQGIHKDFGSQILWGRVIDNAFPVLLEMVEDLLETKGLAKEGGPWHAVFESETALFKETDDKSMARKHFLLLMLAKKLLGGLKTRVNQSMEDIRVLSDNEEIELEALMEEADIRAEELKDRDPEPDIRVGYHHAGPNNSLVSSRATSRGLPPIFEEESTAVRHEVVAEIDIAPEGDCRQNGRHTRTTMRWKRLNGDMFQETYCKDCRQVIKRAETQRQRRIPEECQHLNAEWVGGHEGSEATCTECKAPIPNPETYQWISAGLEPYGDDPTKDEVITLCSDY